MSIANNFPIAKLSAMLRGMPISKNTGVNYPYFNENLRRPFNTMHHCLALCYVFTSFKCFLKQSCLIFSWRAMANVWWFLGWEDWRRRMGSLRGEGAEWVRALAWALNIARINQFHQQIHSFLQTFPGHWLLSTDSKIILLKVKYRNHIYNTIWKWYFRLDVEIFFENLFITTTLLIRKEVAF